MTAKSSKPEGSILQLLAKQNEWTGWYNVLRMFFLVLVFFPYQFIPVPWKDWKKPSLIIFLSLHSLCKNWERKQKPCYCNSSYWFEMRISGDSYKLLMFEQQGNAHTGRTIKLSASKPCLVKPDSLYFPHRSTGRK